MDYTGRVSLTIAVGIVFAMFYSRRTGWSAGGLITPGLMALRAFSPWNFVGILTLALLFAMLLRLLTRFFGIYGRERVGAALLIALSFRFLFRNSPGVDAFWIGWIAPGLIAADIERQGAFMTLAAVISTGLATAFFIYLSFLIAGYLI